MYRKIKAGLAGKLAPLCCIVVVAFKPIKQPLPVGAEVILGLFRLLGHTWGS